MNYTPLNPPPLSGQTPLIDLNRTDEIIDRCIDLQDKCPFQPHPCNIALIWLYYDGSSRRISELRKLTKIRSEYLLRIAQWLGYKPNKNVVRWKADEIELLKEHFGYLSMPRLKKRLPGRSERAILTKCVRLKLSIRSNQGCYSAYVLSKILKTDRNIIYEQWIPRGLQFFNYSKRKNLKMIDPEALHDFFRRFPEAYNWLSLSRQRQLQLGFIDERSRLRLPLPPLEKKVVCNAMHARKFDDGKMAKLDNSRNVNKVLCGHEMWVDLYDRKINCPRCGSLVSPWAHDYRGQRLIESRRPQFDDAHTKITALGY